MITVRWIEPTEYRVYHIKTVEGESLYVGQSNNVFKRLDEHKHSTTNNPPFGEYLQLCDASNLIVDVYTLGECEAATDEKGQDAVSWMECNLINQFKPRFNRRMVKYVRKRYHERPIKLGATDNLF